MESSEIDLSEFNEDVNDAEAGGDGQPGLAESKQASADTGKIVNHHYRHPVLQNANVVDLYLFECCDFQFSIQLYSEIRI